MSMDARPAVAAVLADLRVRRDEIDATIEMLLSIYGFEATALKEQQTDPHPEISAAERELMGPSATSDADLIAAAIAAGKVTKCPPAYVAEVKGGEKLAVPERTEQSQNWLAVKNRKRAKNAAA